MRFKLVLWVCLVCITGELLGQKPYTISGSVFDERGDALPGTSLLLSPGNHWAVSDQNGRYAFVALDPGTYVLEASFIGYVNTADTLVLRDNYVLNISMERALQNLQEVEITGDYAAIRNREEALSIEAVNDSYLRQNMGGSLMKSLERLPGVDAMSIGSGQSKPVIRGLSFNRVVVVDRGINHEGQQWGSDHGLEIDQYAVDRAEVIKGPSSLHYGSDAIGGVIVLDQEAIPEKRSWGGNADLRAASNNALLGTSLRLFVRGDKLYAALRGSYLDYGDYRVPADSVDIYSYRAPLHNNYLRNTAGREANFHLEAGWKGEGLTSRLFISRLGSRNGFFANAHGLEPRMVDTGLHDRSSRDIQYPYHLVNHWKVISRSRWSSAEHALDVDLGFQRNFRQEWSQYVNHGYMPPVFPDTLPSPSDLEREFEKVVYSGKLSYAYRTSEGLSLTGGIQSEYQDNRIDGRGFIIPEFDQTRLGSFLVLKYRLSTGSVLSGGLRYDAAWIHTRAYLDWFSSPVISESDTTEERLQRSPDLSRQFRNLSWTLGYNLNREHLVFKLNLGKSFRMPLAKELAANGVNYHRFSYEVGNPDLSPETAYQLDAGLEWKAQSLAVGLSPFLAWFPNYIYLNPGYEHDRLYGNGNQVYWYTESEVLRLGGELHAHFQLLSSLKAGIIGEYIYSEQLSGEKEGFGLPFSPPASLLLNLKYTPKALAFLRDPYASVDLRVVSRQERIVPPEEATPGYHVVHIGFGGNIRIARQLVSVDFQVRNLMNRKYFDHTSYYRLVNVPEAGRSINLSISLPFSGKLKG